MDDLNVVVISDEDVIFEAINAARHFEGIIMAMRAFRVLQKILLNPDSHDDWRAAN